MRCYCFIIINCATMYSDRNSSEGPRREDHILRGSGLIGVQSFINIGVATGLIPNTGVPLPFVSYGMTSIVSLYIRIGIVLNTDLHRKNTNKERIQ